MISVDPNTFVIAVPRADLALVSGTLYNHDTDAFRLEMKSFEDSEHGMAMPKTHDHNTEVTIVGTTYIRAIKILPPYSIEYENGFYSVVLQGSNNNIFDIEGGVLVQNNVQVIPGNSAGLQIVVQGSGVTQQDKNDIAALSSNQVWTDKEEVEANIKKVNDTEVQGMGVEGNPWGPVP